MTTLDKLRQRLQIVGGTEQVVGGTEQVVGGYTDGVPVALIITGILGTIGRFTIARWANKFNWVETGKSSLPKDVVEIMDMVFKFGKYRHATVKWLAFHYPDYLNWLLDKATMFDKDPEIQDLFRSALGWAETTKADDLLPRCFGKFDNQAALDLRGKGCDTGTCDAYHACQSDKPCRVFQTLVREIKSAAKRGGDVDPDKLERKAKIDWPQISSERLDQLLAEAHEYVSRTTPNK